MHARTSVTRTPTPCPTCGGPARAASYRDARQPGSKSTRSIAIGRPYCPACDDLVPRDS